MTTVEVQTFGVDIKQEEKKKQIFLSTSAWSLLAECKTQIDKALETNTVMQQTIDDRKDIKVHTSSFNGKTYLHIRAWWQNRPTKNGVSFLQNEWEELKDHLTMSAESTLGISVMKQLIQKRLQDVIRDICDGCINDWPSQRDHICLVEIADTTEKAVNKIKEDIVAKDFILLLAKEANKQDLILEIPHQTFKRVMAFHWDSIKEDIVERADEFM